MDDDTVKRVSKKTRIVLGLVVNSGSPLWGWKLAQAMGCSPTTIYSILHRMVADGWVERSWQHSNTGPARILYVATDAGRDAHGRFVEAVEDRERADG